MKVSCVNLALRTRLRALDITESSPHSMCCSSLAAAYLPRAQRSARSYEGDGGNDQDRALSVELLELLKENMTLWKEEDGDNNIEDL
jgi:hypothetical protein